MRKTHPLPLLNSQKAKSPKSKLYAKVSPLLYCLFRSLPSSISFLSPPHHHTLYTIHTTYPKNPTQLSLQRQTTNNYPLFSFLHHHTLIPSSPHHHNPLRFTPKIRANPPPILLLRRKICLGTYRAATPIIMATLSIGTLAICKREAPSIGTNVTLLLGLSFANTSLPLLPSSWLVVAMPVNFPTRFDPFWVLSVLEIGL